MRGVLEKSRRVLGRKPAAHRQHHEVVSDVTGEIVSRDPRGFVVRINTDELTLDESDTEAFEFCPKIRSDIRLIALAEGHMNQPGIEREVLIGRN